MAIEVRGVTPLLQAFNMRASVAFYRDVLGFELVDRYEPDGNLYWAMLKLGGAVVMLNSRYEAKDQPAAADPKRYAIHDDTGLYFGCDDVEAVYRQVQSAGWKVEAPVVTHYGMKQVYLKDPDGFVLCFQQRV